MHRQLATLSHCTLHAVLLLQGPAVQLSRGTRHAQACRDRHYIRALHNRSALHKKEQCKSNPVEMFLTGHFAFIASLTGYFAHSAHLMGTFHAALVRYFAVQLSQSTYTSEQVALHEALVRHFAVQLSHSPQRVPTCFGGGEYISSAVLKPSCIEC